MGQGWDIGLFHALIVHIQDRGIGEVAGVGDVDNTNVILSHFPYAIKESYPLISVVYRPDCLQSSARYFADFTVGLALVAKLDNPFIRVRQQWTS